jgi:hypothetical protein
MVMVRLVTTAVLLGAFAVTASAQRGGGHGGGSFHSASSFHGATAFHSSGSFRGNSPGFRLAPSTGYRPKAYTPYGGARPSGNYNRSPVGSRISPVRPAFYRGDRDHRPYADHRRPIVNLGYGYYPYGYAGWIDPGLWDADDTDYPNGPYVDDTSAEANNNAAQLAAEPLSPVQPEPTSPRQAQSQPPQPADDIALIFKDGHSETIHNYIATRTTLTVIQGHRERDIAISNLDLAATQKANRAAGVDFNIPTGQ